MSDEQDRIDAEPAKAFLRRHPDITGRFIIKGKLMRLDRRTRCGHVYPREIWARELERYCQKLPQFGYIGEAFYVEEEGVRVGTDLASCAFLVHEVVVEEGGVQIKAEILPTPAGRVLAKMYEDGAVIFGPRGMGQVAPDGTVGDDYRLEGLDAVLNDYGI